MTARNAEISRRVVLTTALIGLIIGQTARAAQPPMTQKEMDENSEAVAIVDVLGVVCDRTENGGAWYTGWIQVKEVIKGDLEVNSTLITHFTRLGPRLAGVNVVLHPGERVRVCLNNDGGADTYNVWHQDGWKVVRQSRNPALPAKPGDVVLAPR
jgi:hypothetical protein